MHERLSALMDGELDDDSTGRAVDDLLASPGERGRWARYHLIGDALRGQAATVPPDFARTLRERIGAEPTVIGAPPARRRRPALALAAAAAIAAVAIVVTDRSEPTPGAGGVAVADAAAGASAQVATPVAARDEQAAARTVIVPVGPEPRLPPSQLNVYLVNFSEQRTSMGAPGTMPPYVRLVSHSE